LGLFYYSIHFIGNNLKDFSSLTGGTLFCFGAFGGGRFFLTEEWIFVVVPEDWGTVTWLFIPLSGFFL
jgi:hypothetical protein